MQMKTLLKASVVHFAYMELTGNTVIIKDTMTLMILTCTC